MQSQTYGTNGFQNSSNEDSNRHANPSIASHASNAAGIAAPPAAITTNDEAKIVVAHYAYVGTDESHLQFNEGDYIDVWGEEPSGWWDGFLIKSQLPTLNSRGWFPSNYVRPLKPDEASAFAEYRQQIAPAASHRHDLGTSQGSTVTPGSSMGGTILSGQLSQEQDPLEGSRLDVLLGRRGDDSPAPDLHQLLGWSPSGAAVQPMEDDALASFSSGGDIFGEIAAAAAADHLQESTLPSQDPIEMLSPSSGDQQHSVTANSLAQTVLLPPHDIQESASAKERAVADLRSSVRSNLVDPDWVPKVASDGRIFYYNTRTGQSASDLPSPSASSNASRHLRSESGTAASDKSKWTSGSTSISEHHVRDLTGSSVATTVATAKDTSSTDEGTISIGRASIADSARKTRYSYDSELSGQGVGSLETDGFPDSINSSQQAASDVPTPRKHSLARQSDSSVWLASVASSIPKSSQATLAQLERQCTNALGRLSQAVQQRVEVADNRRFSSDMHFQAEEHLARKGLEDAAIEVNDTTRQLLASTDVILERPQRTSIADSTHLGSDRNSLDSDFGLQASHNADAALNHLPKLPGAQFRPLAMKITATESKLMLSLRTNWGLLSTSPNEETSAETSQKTDSLTEEEIAALYRQRNIQLASRRDIETKLRFDLLVQIRTLGEAISTFVEEVEIYSSKMGHSVGKNALLAHMPTSAAFHITPREAVLPVSSTTGSRSGHGFGYYHATDSTDYRPRHDRSIESGAARISQRALSPTILQELQSDRKALLEDLSALRTIVQTVLGSQFSAKRMASSCIPTVTTQMFGFMRRLARFMKGIEGIDIAGTLDISTPIHADNATTNSSIEQSKLYNNMLQRATTLLAEFNVIKDKLYAVLPAILRVMQSLTTCPPLSPELESSSPMAPPIQPRDVSPLSYRPNLATAMSVHVSTLIEVLENITDLSAQLMLKLNGMQDVSRQQNSGYPALREGNRVMRQLASEAERTAAAAGSVSVNGLLRRGHRANDDDLAEELRERPRTPDRQARLRRDSESRSTIASEPVVRTPSAQSGRYRHMLPPGRSRASSVANSLASDDTSRTSDRVRTNGEDGRNQGKDANGKDAATNHSPSKSKLKQFFGDEAPAQNVHRPPTTVREVLMYMQQDYTHNEITFGIDNSIKAGTLHALICRLTNHMSADSQYNNAFLMTHRTFTNANELLARLKARYYIDPPPGIKAEDFQVWAEQKQKLIRARVINVIRLWITDHLYEEDENALLDRISAFAVTLPNESSQQIARIIERRRLTGAPRRMTASMSSGIPPQPLLPRNLKKMKFLDIDPLEIARQFTIMDSKLFSKISVEECLTRAWPKKFGNKPTPTFTAIADLSNAVTEWVAMSIVLQSDLRRRVAVFKHFIAVADKCRQLSNFTTLLHIVAGLNCSAIYRLKRTKELINQRMTSTSSFLENLVSPENNHALYRDALRLVGSPCVPYLGVYFTDWVMSGEANSDMLRDKPDQINFAKRAKVAESIQQIQLHQTTPYSLHSVPAISKWVEEDMHYARAAGVEGTNVSLNAGQATNNAIMQKAYELSLKIEPREREDERIARLLSESGFL